MADERKDGAKNPSYCYSTAVSDAVLAATCVYGRLFHTITNKPSLIKGMCSLTRVSISSGFYLRAIAGPKTALFHAKRE